MNTLNKYRDNGAIGSLLDEYEKSIEELKQVIADLSDNDLIEIIDQETEDEDCRSVQSILTHVVRGGYTYVIEMRKWLGETIAYKDKKLLGSSDEYSVALDEMFAYSEKLFKDYPNIKLEENNSDKKYW